MRTFSQLDVAPTAARILGISLPQSDGQFIDLVGDWECRNVVLIIVDSLGYDLYRWLEPRLRCLPLLAAEGHLLRAEAVSGHTTPSIATLLNGLLPEHHRILDKAGARKSTLPSIPDIAAASGLRSAVIMEQSGADVYSGIVEIARGIPDDIPPAEFDRKACDLTLEALDQEPRLLVSYFIGIDKAVHLGQGLVEIREAALQIDRCIGEIASAADERCLLIICGDHPVHAGRLKRSIAPYCVAMILSKGRGKESPCCQRQIPITGGLTIGLNAASG